MNIVSRRTRLVAVAGVAVIAVAYGLILAGAGGEFGTSIASDLGGLVIDVLATVMALGAALAFRPGEALRRQWLAIGVGVALFTLGDLTWSFIELVQRADVPYPGLPDVFYVSVYPCLGLGLFLAAFAYRRLLDVRIPLAEAVVVTLALAVVLGVGMLPALIGADLGLSEQILSIFYPLGDLLFQFAPALFVALVVARLKGGVLGWPWWAIAIGVGVLAVTDTTYSWLEAKELYRTGQIVDIGWMFGYLLIAVGASLARDVNRV